MKLTVADFHWQDFIEVDRYPVEKIAVADVEAHARFLADGSKAYTLWADDRIVMCCGVRKMWQGTGEVWCHANRSVSAITRGRAIKRFACDLFERAGRGYTCIIAMFSPQYGRTKLLKELGLSRVGLIENYTPDDCDVILYVKGKRCLPEQE